jgi:hypothetical protein
MLSCVDYILRDQKGRWLIHHHHSFLSLLTDPIKDTAHRNTISPNSDKWPEISSRQGQASPLPFKNHKDTTKEGSFIKEAMTHFTDLKTFFDWFWK